MSDDPNAYADAVNRLEDMVCRATVVVGDGLTDKEIAKELRRIAQQIEDEAQ